MPFHSNRALLSAIFSNFKADNNCVFKIFLIYFGTFPPYYRVFFRLFGPKIIVLLIFSLGKRRIVRFLAWIAFYYWEFLKLFWHIISVILSIFTFFFTFFRYHFTQIAPYYRSLFRILRPIISVFVTIFLIYFGIFPTYYRVFFRLFRPKLSVIMMFFFSLENVELCDLSSNYALLSCPFLTFFDI